MLEINVTKNFQTLAKLNYLSETMPVKMHIEKRQEALHVEVIGSVHNRNEIATTLFDVRV